MRLLLGHGDAVHRFVGAPRCHSGRAEWDSGPPRAGAANTRAIQIPHRACRRFARPMLPKCAAKICLDQFLPYGHLILPRARLWAAALTNSLPQPVSSAPSPGPQRLAPGAPRPRNHWDCIPDGAHLALHSRTHPRSWPNPSPAHRLQARCGPGAHECATMRRMQGARSMEPRVDCRQGRGERPQPRCRTWRDRPRPREYGAAGAAPAPALKPSSPFRPWTARSRLPAAWCAGGGELRRVPPECARRRGAASLGQKPPIPRVERSGLYLCRPGSAPASRTFPTRHQRRARHTEEPRLERVERRPSLHTGACRGRGNSVQGGRGAVASTASGPADSPFAARTSWRGRSKGIGPESAAGQTLCIHFQAGLQQNEQASRSRAVLPPRHPDRPNFVSSAPNNGRCGACAAGGVLGRKARGDWGPCPLLTQCADCRGARTRRQPRRPRRPRQTRQTRQPRRPRQTPQTRQPRRPRQPRQRRQRRQR